VVSRCSSKNGKRNEEKAASKKILPPIIAVARPPTVGVVGRALVVALLVEQLPSATRVETATPADIALNLVSGGKLIPVHGGERGVLRKQSGRQERLWRHLWERLRLLHAEVLLWEGAGIWLLLPSTLLLRFFFKQWTDTHATSFGSEMTPQRIGTCEPPIASPVIVILEITAADKLLLARVQTLVSLAIVLTGKCLPAHTTHKGPLVCVSAQMRAQVVRAGKALRAECALECRRMLLRALRIAVSGDGARGIGKVKNVVAVRHAGRRRAAR
jgi:hypothetical protein